MFRKDQNGVIDPVFIIVLVLVLVVGGFAYWRTSQNKEEVPVPAQQTETTEESALISTEAEEYKRTTTVPADWKSVSDSKYSFGFSHPPSWDVTFDSKGNPSQFVYEVGMGPDEQSFAALIGVTDLSLEEIVARYKKDYINNESAPLTVTSERNILFDGAVGYEICFSDNDNGTNCQHFITLGDSAVIETSPVYGQDLGTEVIAKDSLILFESLNFK